MNEYYDREKERALDRPREYPVSTPPPYSPPQITEEDVHLKDYLGVIARRKWVAITFLIAVLTTVTIGTFLKTPLYRSTVTIRIDKENPHILDFKDVVGIERAEEDYFQTQYKILKSRNLAKRVIRSLGLDKNREFSPEAGPVGKKQDPHGLARQVSLLEEDSITPALVDSFLKRVEVSPLQKSRLVNVSFSSYDPELAARGANAIGDAFIELNIESKFEATNQARTWLGKQLEAMKAKVEQAEEGLNEYAAKNGIIFLDRNDGDKGGDTQNIVTKNLSEMSSELTSATSERISREALYREITKGDPESSSTVMNNPLVLELKKTYASMESDYNQQLKVYKPDYPKMVKLREHISQVKKRIDQETKKVVSSVQQDFQVAVKREKQLQAAIDSQKKQAMQLNQRSVQYQILKREADTNKELYNGLLQRLKETGVSASLTASNIQILDRAEVAKVPYKPRKGMNIMLSLLVGLLGGVGLAFFTDYLDNTVKTAQDVEKKMYLPPLGLVPYHDNDNFPVEGIAHSDTDSPLAEAYRSLRTFLLLSSGGKPPRIVMVTSPTTEEGKTTTSVNTAISLTMSNKKVVIVDADMRRPRLHHVFFADNQVGLSSFLSGNVEFGSGIIKPSGIENLDVITGGPLPPNPSELLGSYRFQELVHGLYALYNFIIIDTPPVLGISDALIVSQWTDGVVLVLRSGKTPKETAQEARRLLAGVNAKILGVVLNSISQNDMKYSGYYNHYKYYRQNEKDV